MKGFALPELVIAMLILGVALVPLAGVFTRGSLRAGISAVQYAALVQGRAELDELRQVDYDALKGRAHDWRSGGHAFRATVEAGGASAAVKSDRGLVLPPEYARIETRLEVGEEVTQGASALRRVTVRIRWQEHGAGHTRAPEALAQLTTILGSHKLVRGVR